MSTAAQSARTNSRQMRSMRRVLASVTSWAIGIGIAAWLVLTPFVGDISTIRSHSQTVILVAAVLGVNIATGYGGMISLGHGVFVAMGSFGAAYCVDQLELPWAVGIAGGMAVAAATGAVVGLPALRIRGIYLALVTLGLAIVFQPLAKRFPAFTGGVSGRNVQSEVVAPGWWPHTGRAGDASYRYVLCLVIMAAAIWATAALLRGRPGRTIKAVRDNSTAAAVFGVHLTRTRVSTFALSAALAGLTGAFGVMLVPYISQESFPPQESLLLYATAVIGGLGILWGPVLGVALREGVAQLAELLDLSQRTDLLGELAALLRDQAIVFGVGLIVLTFAFPKGVAGVLADWLRRDAQSRPDQSRPDQRLPANA